MKTNCWECVESTKQIIGDDERYIATTYSVFPGIEFTFVDVHSQQVVNEQTVCGDNILEITYCREGRSEFNLKDEFVFLSSGDLMIVKTDTYMLEYTDKSILEIAMEHGYDNGSKFAAAFRSIKGMNPMQYRNEMHMKSRTI